MLTSAGNILLRLAWPASYLQHIHKNTLTLGGPVPRDFLKHYLYYHLIPFIFFDLETKTFSEPVPLLAYHFLSFLLLPTWKEVSVGHFPGFRASGLGCKRTVTPSTVL